MGSLLKACEAQDPALADHLRAWHTEVGHYQDGLEQILHKQRELAGHPLSILETGVRAGLSSDRILTALDAQGGGTLVSVDPYAEPGLYRIRHSKWQLVPMLSQQYLRQGWAQGLQLPLDVFLHDSDHEVWCQTFEYEIAWYFVRPGGLIMTDDPHWGPHGAWPSFLARHSLQAHEAGNLRYATKPTDAPAIVVERTIGRIIEVAAKLADAALTAWELQNSPA